ncbi:MAG: class I SAM-dependent DNA methyltransferase [Hylemonella sp.]|nr:class I SAM-dependent DNA methyltransferase [Hylemonella sp.]MDP1937117.1 class I SAM-dependent DNA methyltransferase [Hylemonella sp.]
MPLSWNEIKSRALNFSRTWADAANEDSEAKPFWIAFFEIFGITDKRVATFELNVKKHGGGQGFVDLFWPGMLLVEQKSRGKNLDAAFNQALGYFPGINERDLPQIIIVCDFAHFRVHKLATGETYEFALKDLHKHIRLFGFIAGYKAQEIKAQDPVNIKAAERMGRLHDALKASGFDGHPLEVLLVRVLFCLFADDTGIFQPAQSFRSFIEERTATDGSDLGSRLAQLFQVLNTPAGKRSQALDEQLANFPYINGKLFEEALPLADFTAAMREALLDACALDWSAISPAIFGSLFQSIMDEKARRNLGAHYTSEENILKLIQPLFLDELRAEFNKVKGNRNRLFEFHKKLRLLKFFDPACGCGNFLVISYRELRELELEVLRASHQLSGMAGQQSVDVHSLIGVDVDQFYGIEIEEFPAQIAQVALWLMDHQMNLRVSEEFGLYFARIPLKSTPHIVHGNALRLDWNEVLPAELCSYVLGNPPFVGAMVMSDAQREDVALVFADLKGYGVLDFVSCWYWKAAKYMADYAVRTAFVSTNSITQGEQVGLLWGPLTQRFGLRIAFAHQTFRWSNEARGMAAVHCVIIGFAKNFRESARLFEYDDVAAEPHEVQAANINSYLLNAPDVYLANRSDPICAIPPMRWGSMPRDGGHLVLSAVERLDFLKSEPWMEPYIKPYIGADEFLKGSERYCLWLPGVSPAVLAKSPKTLARLAEVKRFRESSKAASTQKFAATPGLFCQIAQPESDYLMVPLHTSEGRNYIPIGYMPSTAIASNACGLVPDAGLFHFGVIQAAMHMAWVRITCGRLESRFRYSKDIVYNNYPWPEVLTDIQRQAIETAAQAVLDARAQFPGSSLADLYDPLTMPPALLKAHQNLDAAVDKAYEASGGKKSYKSDAERVAFLFELYQKYTSLLPVAPVKKGRKTKAA